MRGYELTINLGSQMNWSGIDGVNRPVSRSHRRLHYALVRVMSSVASIDSAHLSVLLVTFDVWKFVCEILAEVIITQIRHAA